MPVYSIAIIQFDDISPSFTTTDTVGNSVVGDTYTISSGAVPITIRIDDDDPDFDDGYIDPPGNSTGANNQLVAEPVTINGTSYGPPGAGGTPEDQIELEFAFTTSDGDTYYVVRINGANVGLSGPVLPQPGQTFTISSASDGSDTPYDDIPCFVAGTEILTPYGTIPVEQLAPGDLVETVDHGPQPLLQVTETRLGIDELQASPELRPIVFARGSFGNTRPMRLSPQHRVLVAGWQAELFFGEVEVLVPAKALVNGTSVVVAPVVQPVSYFHLLFEQHQLVYSDGCVTESLYPGGRLARAVQVEQIRTLAALIGEAGGADGPRMARPVVQAREAASLSLSRI